MEIRDSVMSKLIETVMLTDKIFEHLDGYTSEYVYYELLELVSDYIENRSKYKKNLTEYLDFILGIDKKTFDKCVKVSNKKLQNYKKYCFLEWYNNMKQTF